MKVAFVFGHGCREYYEVTPEVGGSLPYIWRIPKGRLEYTWLCEGTPAVPSRTDYYAFELYRYPDGTVEYRECHW